MERRLKNIYIAVFCIYLTAVALLCFLRPSSLPEVDIKTFLGIPIDKCLHFLMFLPFPILSGLVFTDKERSFLSGLAIMTVLAVVGSGLAYGTELIQAHTGYRAYEIGDFIADAIGICAGTVIFLSYTIITRLKK